MSNKENQNFIETYQTYKNLPPLAGIGNFSTVANSGHSVEACVNRLKRIHWSFKRLHGIFIKRLTAEPIYELKMSFSLHAHYCAEHTAALRKRVGEMREPPLGLNVIPNASLDIFFDEILSAPQTELLIRGIYFHALPALKVALETHIATTNPLADHPSLRVCRFALLEVNEMVSYGEKAVEHLTPTNEEQLKEWDAFLSDLLKQAGTLDGSAEVITSIIPKRHFSENPTAYEKIPRRDHRFPDPFNMGVHAEAFLYDPEMPVETKPLMLFYKRLREIDVPEMMASILAETTDKPWEYTVDMTRQLWDEARHAMMGEVGFVQAGLDWQKLVKINFTFSHALNTQLEPLERHAVLFYIEQGLMPKTGKRFEWETAIASGEGFAALIQDYDWADEVLHARIGRDWYVTQIGDRKKAIEHGDECWNRVFIDWQSYIDKGLTKHENWWPALYQEWCKNRNLAPDPTVISYNTSYAAVRADLKDLSISG
jgi:hypothetical protein